MGRKEEGSRAKADPRPQASGAASGAARSQGQLSGAPDSAGARRTTVAARCDRVRSGSRWNPRRELGAISGGALFRAIGSRAPHRRGVRRDRAGSLLVGPVVRGLSLATATATAARAVPGLPAADLAGIRGLAKAWAGGRPGDAGLRSSTPPGRRIRRYEPALETRGAGDLQDLGCLRARRERSWKPPPAPPLPGRHRGEAPMCSLERGGRG
jgi:hypothetical protein